MQVLTLIRLIISLVQVFIPVVKALPKLRLSDLRVIGGLVWKYRRYIKPVSVSKLIDVLRRVETFSKAHQAFLIGLARMATSVSSFIKKVIAWVKALVAKVIKQVEKVKSAAQRVWAVLNTRLW